MFKKERTPSKRVVKPKRLAEYAYDEDSLNFLAARNSSGSNLHHTSPDSNILSVANINVNNENTAETVYSSWSSIRYLNSYLPSHSHFSSGNVRFNVGDSSSLVEGSRSLGQSQNTPDNVSTDDSELCCGTETRGRKTSSTRLDFLDHYSIVSVSPTPRVDTSEMSTSDNETGKSNSKDKENECDCSESVTCSFCTAGKEEATKALFAALTEALGKIDVLTNKMDTLELEVQKLKNSSSESSGSEIRSVSSKKNLKSINVKKKSSGKEDRVEAEKDRQLGLMKEKLKSWNRKTGDVSTTEESAGSDLNMKVLRKKMSKKHKDDCDKKLASKLKLAGACFPEDDSSSSGTESSEGGSKSRARKKVKSGAKIKKRPVVRTELWPHTIANEDDGDEVTSEDIGLAKFLSCFTYIMVNCGKLEAAGRAELLHAVSSVLECLPWADARAFHNLVMTKLEQGRLVWKSDFSTLAHQFLDKKVRLNLRSKGTASGANSAFKTSSSGRSFGKGFANPRNNNTKFNSNFNNNSNRNKSLYAVVCSQWNFGNCGYGDRCRKWHVCWSCAETGKPGEQHKASSHNSSVGSRQNDPRS